MNTKEHQVEMPTEPQLIEVEQRGSGKVSREQMEKVADLHAREVWGEHIARGQPLPITNVDGKLIHYAFPYVIGSKEFPEGRIISEHLRKPSQSLGAIDDPKEKINQAAVYPSRVAVRDEIMQFGTVYVSVTKDNYPVTRVDHELHPGFYNLEHALAQAKETHGFSQPSLVRICMESPLHEYFEIVEGGKRVRLQVNSLLSSEKVESGAVKDVQGNEASHKLQKLKMDREDAVSRAWKGYLNRQFSSPSTAYGKAPIHKTPLPLPLPDQISFEYLIPRYELIPPLLWTKWCSPTAASMVLAFWDNYIANTVSWAGYGRIVDYWLNHPESSHNVPNLLDELVDDLTDGLSWEARMEEFSNIINGYDWSFEVVRGNQNNDWAWDTLEYELHAGRPVKLDIFASDPEIPGHSICVFGYRIIVAGSTMLKYLILYNTWNEKRVEWLVDQIYWYGGGDTDYFNICCYRPDGEEPDTFLALLLPNGGEILTAWQKYGINFYAAQDIKYAQIEYSIDGGQTWHFVVEIAVTPGWNEYYWNFPILFSTKTRIRIKGFSESREYLAGTGSFQNFTVYMQMMASVPVHLISDGA